MKKYFFIPLLGLLFLDTYGQEKPMLVFDLVNNTMDSLPMVAFDSTTLHDNTNYFIGYFNSITATLPQTRPVANVYPGSNFTYKKQASIDYNLTAYPFRTSVKIVAIENDSLKNNCSGSLISRKHVLTSAHCVSILFSNTLMYDSLAVFPVFDNGVANSNFDASRVAKIYFFKDWSLTGEDIAVLELEEPIGDMTGWLSIGFNEVDSILTDGIFYKFSYPGTTILSIDSNSYNGDTMYYNYGEIDIVNSTMIGITGSSGIPGESGSSIIKIINDEEYTTYGVLTFSSDLMHSKINNWQFYALKNIIANDLVAVLPEKNDEPILVYPNPVSSLLYVKNESEHTIIGLSFFDGLGRLVLTIDQENYANGVDISNLSSGFYYLKVTTNTFVETTILVKK